MTDVYVRFTNDLVHRTMSNEEGDIRTDISTCGVLVGVALSGAIAVVVDGKPLDMRGEAAG